MNKFYKVVFCNSTGTMKAVSETAKSGKKTKSVTIAAGVLAAGVIFSATAMAAEVGDPILSGSTSDGFGSIAVGETNTVTGNRTTAVGDNNNSKGESNTLIGTGNTAESYYDPYWDEEVNSEEGTLVGANNSVYGRRVVTVGTNNNGDADYVTITGSSNNVNLENSGAYGQTNRVSGDPQIATFARLDDGFSTARVSEQYVQSGSYAYGNSNDVAGDKSHAVGNSNFVNGDLNSVVGNGNQLTNNGNGGVIMPTAFAVQSVSGTPTGSFLAGNQNSVDANNTHAVGNNNEILNDNNVTLGSSNTVNYLENDNGGDLPSIIDVPQQRAAAGGFLVGNPSTAIVGDGNELRAGGVHIVGTENYVDQQNAYVVGGNNMVEDQSDPFTNNPFDVQDGSNVLGSNNRVSSKGATVSGNNNYVDINSEFNTIAGSQNRASGVATSLVGTSNEVFKDMGGTFGTGNRVIGNTGFADALADSVNSDGEFLGIDIDGDGIIDYTSPEEAQQALIIGGSYAYGNFNQVEGESSQVVGNASQVIGDNSGSFGSKNRLGTAAFFEGNNEAITPAVNADNSFAYGNENTITKDGVQIVGNTNTVERSYSAAIGSSNMLTESLNGELVDATEDDLKRIGTFAYGNNNEVASNGGHVTGNNNQFQADDATAAGNDNLMIGDQGHVVGNANKSIGESNKIFGNQNTAGLDMNGDYSSRNSVMIMGDNNQVSGNNSTAIGDNNNVSGRGALAAGSQNIVDSDSAYVLGEQNTVLNSENSNVIGNQNYIEDAEEATVLGNYNGTQSSFSTLVGNLNSVRDDYSDEVVGIGQNNSLSGNQATAIGSLNTIEKDASGAIGVRNSVSGGYQSQGLVGQGLDGLSDAIDYNEYIERGSYAQGNENLIEGDTTHVYGYRNTVRGNETTALGANNIVSGNQSQVIGNENVVGYNNDGMPQRGDSAGLLGSNNNVQANNSFVVGNNSNVNRDADGSLVLGSNASSAVAGGVAIGNNSVADRANSVSVGSAGAERQVVNVADGTQDKDAVNLGQLNASVRDTTAGKNITATRTDTGYQVALNDDVTLTSVTTGNTSFNTDGVRAGDVFLSSTTGLDNAGNRVTSVGDAIERSDAVNYGQFEDGLAGTIKSVTGDENIIATTDANKNVILNLKKDLNADSLTTGNTIINNTGFTNGATNLGGNGLTVGAVTVSNTGLDNAGNRVTSVGNAIERSDAVNYGQFEDGLAGTIKSVTGDENIIATTDANKNVILNLKKDLNADSLTTGNTIINNTGFTNGATNLGGNGLTVGAVTVSNTGLDNAGNRVTSVGNAIERSDAVNYGQFEDGLAGTIKSVTGDENIIATTDANKNVILNLKKDLNADSLTTGNTIINNTGFTNGATNLGGNGLTVGAVTVSNTGLDNAGNRVTSVGNAIERSDAVNYGQVSDIDDRLTAENVVQNTNITRNTSTITNVGDSVVNSFGGNAAQAADGKITYTNIGGTGQDTLDGAIAAANDSIKSVGGDENITAITDDENNVSLALNKDLNVDSVTTGTTTINTDGVRAGDVFLSSTTGLDNAGNRVTSVGNAIERSDAVNYGQVSDIDDRLTAENVVQNTNITRNTSTITNVGDSVVNSFGGNAAQAADGKITYTNIGGTGQDTLDGAIAAANDSIKSVGGDENITAITDDENNVSLALNKDLNVDSVTTGTTTINTDGVRAGDVFLSSTTGLDNAGNRVTNVGNAIERSDAVNYGQFTDGLNGIVKTTVSGGKNITATRTDTGYEVSLNDTVALTSVTTGTTTIDTDGVRAGDVFLSSTTGLDNAGNRVTSVGNAIERSDAVNYGQVSDIDDRLTAENVVQNTNITRNTSTITNVGDSVVNSFGGNAAQAADGKITYTNIGGTGQDTLDGAIAAANDSIKSVGGDENITAITDDENNVSLALNKDLNVDSVTTGTTTINTDGVRAGDVFLSSTTGLDNAGNRVTNVGNAIERSDAVNYGQVSDIDDRLTAENVVQNTNISSNTAAIDKGFGIGNGVTSNKFDLGDTVDITADSNTKITTTATGVQVGLADNIFVNTVTAGNSIFNDAGFSTGDVSVSRNSGLYNAGFTVTGVGNGKNRDDAVNKGQLDDAISGIVIEGVNVTGDNNIKVAQNGSDIGLTLNKDVVVDTVTTGQSSLNDSGLNVGNVVVSATTGLNNAGFTVSGVGNAVNADDAVNLGQLNEVDTRLTAENAAQNVIIAGKADKSYVDAADQKLQTQIDAKADTSYVDAADQKLQTQIDGKVDKSTFEASQQAQNDNLKKETDRLDAKDQDLQNQVDNKVEKEEFVADQKRQDDALKEESSVRDSKDKDLQAQVDKKVEKEEFVADQKRQDDALKEAVEQSQNFFNSQNASQTAVFEEKMEQASSVNNEKLEQIVAKQSIIDNSQNVLITKNSELIADLGYKVENLEDKLSAGVASSIAFASMPSAMNKGEVRIAGGTGYFNGAGALAIGITGATETGDVTYKFGGSYTKDGGAVVGAGASYRVW